MAFYVTYTSDKKRIVAFLLCVFGGFLGLHQFYVGKLFMGLIYLITGGIFGIGWIIDIIRIVAGSFRDNVGAPLRQ